MPINVLVMSVEPDLRGSVILLSDTHVESHFTFDNLVLRVPDLNPAWPLSISDGSRKTQGCRYAMSVLWETIQTTRTFVKT